jgi:hypothetical protein
MVDILPISRVPVLRHLGRSCARRVAQLPSLVTAV